MSDFPGSPSLRDTAKSRRPTLTNDAGHASPRAPPHSENSSTALKAPIYSDISYNPSPRVPILQQHSEFWTASNFHDISLEIDRDPTNLIKCLPDIQALLEHACLDSSDSCRFIWHRIKTLLLELQKNGSVSTAKVTQNIVPSCAAKPCEPDNYHGDEIIDEYRWLKDRENQEVLNYIEKENEYTQQMMEFTKPLQKLLYKEFVSRVDENQESARVVFPDGCSYYSRKVGEEYLIHVRVDSDGKEQIYLDENIIASSPEFEPLPFFKVTFVKLSATCKYLAYGIDTAGSERNTVYFMNMDTLVLLDEILLDVYEDLEFSLDGNCVYYTTLDDVERANQFKRHILGMNVENDEILFIESDEQFFLTLTITSDARFLVLKSTAQITSETHMIDASDNSSNCMILNERKEGVNYTCEHQSEYFYILTNEEGKNNWIYRVSVDAVIRSIADGSEVARETVIENRDFVLIEDFQFQATHLIVLERSNCRQNIRIIDLKDSVDSDFTTYHYVGFSEAVYTVWLDCVDFQPSYLSRHQYDTHVFRFSYTSFLQPMQVIDYDMNTRQMNFIHEEKVPGLIPYDMSKYASKRLFATGHDGTAVPISIVYRRDLLGLNMSPPQHNHLLLHSYGAYGTCINPAFSACRLSLLDRGFIYAVAHTRGGADMGNGWYEEGKLGKKQNTFYDFISVAEYLIKEQYTIPSKLAIYGRSAGGLLIGAVINMAPHLFQTALTQVPFVDVINTMFDATIPWTAFEYEEWGNPNDLEIYKVMKDYCPYTNINGEKLANNEYPHLLVVGGMNDPRVAFFEPLRFVAKMRGELQSWREKKGIEDGSHAGHGGNSGFYSAIETRAFEFAFLISSLQAPMMCINSEAEGLARNVSNPTDEVTTRIEETEKRKSKKDESVYRYRGTNSGKGKLMKWINNIF